MHLLQRPLEWNADTRLIDQQHQSALIRLWLAFTVTVVALFGVLSPRILLAVLIQLGFQSTHWSSWFAVSTASPCTAPVRCLSVAEAKLLGSVWEFCSVMSFVLLLRYVFFPATSALASYRRHSHQMKTFFRQHDRRYLSMVDGLLDDHVGNERLLFARLRQIYRRRHGAPAPHS
ncbi:TPA: hypothetical protein N0F65_011308 [Lagenidium giganteum]|uniref:Uncharacterized protein n=1 Tax=Lagenidium giganteum TaxID=4803 RepID=A0AAV2YFT3_9STRA|nr:TPA: hypothetical protein N0F65_011308 [Lagenidium giganteum]